MDSLNSNNIDPAVKSKAKSLDTSEDRDNLRLILEKNSYGTYEGLERGVKLAKLIDPLAHAKLQSDYDNYAWDTVRAGLAAIGIFVNDWTLEESLISIGYQKELLEVYKELGVRSQDIAKTFNARFISLKSQDIANEVKLLWHERIRV